MLLKHGIGYKSGRGAERGQQKSDGGEQNAREGSGEGSDNGKAGAVRRGECSNVLAHSDAGGGDAKKE